MAKKAVQEIADEARALVRTAIDAFIGAPSFEALFRIKAAMSKASPTRCPCQIAGCKGLSPILSHCQKCPIFLDEDEWNDDVPGDVCTLLVNDDLSPDQIVHMWDKFKGEILVNLVRFKGYYEEE